MRRQLVKSGALMWGSPLRPHWCANKAEEDQLMPVAVQDRPPVYVSSVVAYTEVVSSGFFGSKIEGLSRPKSRLHFTVDSHRLMRLCAFEVHFSHHLQKHLCTTPCDRMIYMNRFNVESKMLVFFFSCFSLFSYKRRTC